MKIFFVDKGTDISKFQEEYQKQDNSTIFTLDYEMHKVLQKKGIEHNIGEEILDENDFKKIDTFTIDYTEKLFYNFKKYLTVEDIFLPQLIEHELYQYLLIQYLKPLVIYKIIKSNNDIQSIFNFTIYENFIQKIISMKKNIQLISFASKSSEMLYHDSVKFKIHIFNYPLHITLSRKTFSKIKSITNIFIKNIYNLKIKNTGSNNVLLVNFDPLVYEELLIELKNSTKNFLLLNTRKPAITNLRSLNIIRQSKLKILDLDDYYENNNRIENQIKLIKNNLRKIFLNVDYFEKIFSIETFSFWNSIKNSFQNICEARFLESTKRILLLENLFRSHDIENILVWVDVGQEEKECILVGKKSKILSIMLQHGRFQTSEIWNKFAPFLGQFPAPLLSDKQIVWGETTKQYAIKHNHSSENLIVAGSPRHDKFFNFSEKSTENGIIVLATTGTMSLSADSCTTSSQIKYDKFIQEIYRIVKLLPNQKLVVKPHPGKIINKYVRDLINEIDPSIAIIENISNEKLFSSADLLITFNNSTTALESLIVGTPAISLQTEPWANEDDIAQSGTIACISEISECESTIKKILYDKNFKKTLSVKRDSFLKDYLKNPGNASISIANILKEGFRH